jgi:hypothetical protein
MRALSTLFVTSDASCLSRTHLASVKAEETTKTRPSARKPRSHCPTGSRTIPISSAESASPKAMADCAKNAVVVGRWMVGVDSVMGSACRAGPARTWVRVLNCGGPRQGQPACALNEAAGCTAGNGSSGAGQWGSGAGQRGAVPVRGRIYRVATDPMCHMGTTFTGNR